MAWSAIWRSVAHFVIDDPQRLVWAATLKGDVGRAWDPLLFELKAAALSRTVAAMATRRMGAWISSHSLHPSIPVALVMCDLNASDASKQILSIVPGHASNWPIGLRGNQRAMSRNRLNAQLSFVLSLIAATFLGGHASAEDQIFDELRFGTSTSVQGGGSAEDGVFPEITAFFDPFGYESASNWKDQLMRPRVHLGTSIGTAGEATQFFTGFSWTIDLTSTVFAEAGFGGVIHTGNLDGNEDGPNLGCRVLFHEYIGAGYRFTEHWNLLAQIAHSSNANLCSPNDGMTRAGLQVGYKF
jgi:hypothetical protein